MHQVNLKSYHASRLLSEGCPSYVYFEDKEQGHLTHFSLTKMH